MKIRLLSCGYHFIHRDGLVIDRPSGSGNYAFVFFKTGSEIIVGGQRMEAAKHSFVLFQPSTPHQYGEAGKPFINDWLHIQGEGLDELLARLEFPLDMPVQAADPLFISRCIMDIQSLNRMGGPLCEEILDLDLRSLLARLSNWRQGAAPPEKTSRYFQQFTELRNRLYSTPQANLSVDELASSVNLSKSYFQHTYKELFGCSVVWDMIHGRLEHAKYLLDNSTLPVSAIAKSCGYDHDTHFMRQFKKFVGMTPSEYKARS
ncbi:helix-turn-helix domain-containing protein [Paenibacillus puerhi]|uniref:helix-turn-helix domain-containing protein n=1 Tax=Paenibacillus puerhi TaxID=2692622 RepID=UPI00135C44D7|nr:AraC family transcriptional regulator [Paenibacillus puerhi]